MPVLSGTRLILVLIFTCVYGSGMEEETVGSSVRNVHIVLTGCSRIVMKSVKRLVRYGSKRGWH